jgi:hypothetical protein
MIVSYRRGVKLIGRLNQWMACSSLDDYPAQLLFGTPRIQRGPIRCLPAECRLVGPIRTMSIS